MSFELCEIDFKSIEVNLIGLVQFRYERANIEPF